MQPDALHLNPMPCGHDLSCVRLQREPHPACASSASRAGGFADASPTGRVAFSGFADDYAGQEVQGPATFDPEYPECEEGIEFPADVFDCADGMPAANDVRMMTFRALLPAIRRIAIHSVERARQLSAGSAEQPRCYSVYLLDCDGGEHPFLDFASAGSATYAALRIAQAYRLPVEFGSFAEPKSREP